MLTFAFDLDNTLYDRNGAIYEAFRMSGLSKKINYDDFLNAFSHFSDIAFESFKKKKMSLASSQLYRIEATLHHFEYSYTSKELQNFQNYYDQAKKNIKLFDFVPIMLNELIAANAKVILITNGPVENQCRKISTLGLEKWFTKKEYFISEEIGLSKPNPDIFQFVERTMHLNPQRTWYIGDSYEYDVLGSLNAGWKAIWFNRSKEVSPSSIMQAHNGKELSDLLSTLLETHI